MKMLANERPLWYKENMKIGISTASYFNTAATEESVKRIAALGCDTCEVFLTSSCEYDSLIDVIDTSRGEFPVHSVHALSSQFEPQLFSTNERVRTDAEKVFSKVVAAAAKLGAKYYTFHGVMALKYSTARNVASLADGFKDICSEAKRSGVSIALENVHYTLTASPHEIGTALDACPDLCATLDVKHAALAGYDAIDYLNIMKDRLVTLHVCDITADNRACLPFNGTYPFEKLFEAIDKLDIEVAALIEVYKGCYKEESELKQAVERLRGLTKSKTFQS